MEILKFDYSGMFTVKIEGDLLDLNKPINVTVQKGENCDQFSAVHIEKTKGDEVEHHVMPLKGDEVPKQQARVEPDPERPIFYGSSMEDCECGWDNLDLEHDDNYVCDNCHTAHLFSCQNLISTHRVDISSLRKKAKKFCA